LNDILTTDISFLNQLRDSKLAIIEKRDKARGGKSLSTRSVMSADEFAERARRQGQKDI
jgi:hypothetical protein